MTTMKQARLDGRRAGVALARGVTRFLDENPNAPITTIIDWAREQLVDEALEYTMGTDYPRSQRFLDAAIDALIEVLRSPLLAFDEPPAVVIPFAMCA